jgi:hypothetical protein
MPEPIEIECAATVGDLVSEQAIDVEAQPNALRIRLPTVRATA